MRFYELLGKDWALNFRKRHPELALRSPESTSIARARAFNKEAVALFFNLYENLHDKYHFKAERIFNLDETGITTVQKPGKILAAKGKKQVGMISSAERGSLVTMCNVVNASGNALPPVFIFPRVNFKDHMLKNAPPSSLGLAALSGRMSAELFPKALQHFMKHMHVSPENRALLLMNNHSSHVSLEIQKMARDAGLSILTFPPHCSHRLQPLDVSVYGPFKKFYNVAVSNWMTSNVGKAVTIYEVAELAGFAYNKAMSKDNIASGFRATGIFPKNVEIFTKDCFLPSMTLLGQHEATSQVQTFKLPKKATNSTPPHRKSRSGAAKILTATPPAETTLVIEASTSVGTLSSPPAKRPLYNRKRKRVQASESSDDDAEDVVPLDDESDSEGDMDESILSITNVDTPVEPNVIEKGNYVLVKFDGKRRSVCFVGKVLEVTEFEVLVDFYRKTERSTFKLPTSKDEKLVEKEQVIQVLPDPFFKGHQTSRTLGSVTFECDFGTKYDIN